MIDLHFYLDLALAFGAGGLVMGMFAAIGNTLARYRIEFRDPPFNGDR